MSATLGGRSNLQFRETSGLPTAGCWEKDDIQIQQPGRIICQALAIYLYISVSPYFYISIPLYLYVYISFFLEDLLH